MSQNRCYDVRVFCVVLFSFFFIHNTCLIRHSVADPPPLMVYCRDAFGESWGQILTQRFGKRIKVLKISSHGLITRLRLESHKTPADMLLGIDTTHVSELDHQGLTVHFPYDKRLNNLPAPWPESTLIPLAYGVLTILRHASTTTMTPLKTLEDLCQQAHKVVIPDPRTSTTGLEFLYWVHQQYGNEAFRVWRCLKPRVLTYPKGLSGSFAIFLASSDLITVGYSTSTLYAKRYAPQQSIRAETMTKAPLQIYGAIITPKGYTHPLTAEVIAFLRSAEFQRMIPLVSALYPAALTDLSALLELTEQLPPLPQKILPPPFLDRHQKAALIQNWLKANQP